MNQSCTEETLKNTLHDFTTFCDYLVANQPRLTRSRRELTKKDCFILNGLLSAPRSYPAPNYLQPSYPTINLFFYIVIETGLFNLCSSRRSVCYLTPTSHLDGFKSLTPINQYMFLFRTYWTKLDYSELYFDSYTMFHHFMYTKLAFEALYRAQPNVTISDTSARFGIMDEGQSPLHNFFVGAGLVVHHLSVFGFWQYEEAENTGFHTSKKDIEVKSLKPTELGIAMIKACRSRPYELYNELQDDAHVWECWQDEQLKPLLERHGLTRATFDPPAEGFEQAFLSVFPPHSINSRAIDQVFHALPHPTEPSVNGNTFIFKVRFEARTWRKIQLTAGHTLKALHYGILAAFQFPEDPFYAFCLDGSLHSQNIFWDNRGNQKPHVDQAILGKLGLYCGQQILYVYGFADQWKLRVNVEQILHTKTVPLKAAVVEQQGAAPPQYPEWVY
ncbi:MAG: hypothetical protein M0Z55_05870 [Peptococcaceae bacterium]|nr:hypothetical protein [Peptococcaceae bacterium]